MRYVLRCLLGIMLVATTLAGCTASNPKLIIVSSNGADSSSTVRAIKDSLFKDWAIDQVARSKQPVRRQHGRKDHSLWRGVGSVCGVRVYGSGIVQTEINGNLGHQIVDGFDWGSPPEVSQQLPPNLGNGWKDITNLTYLEIPYGQGGANYWVKTHGDVIEAWYAYDNERHNIDSPSWAFSIGNNAMGYGRPFTVYIVYRNQPPFRYDYKVINNSIR